MERKLASIQRVVDLQPIEGADFIERARVMGWDTVVKKGEFQVGDLAVFFEIDSVLPQTTWSEFLGEHLRIKTRRLRGVLSQGLTLPVSITSAAGWNEGDDVTALLGVTKWEPEVIPGAFDGVPFPYDIPKTDEIRVQSILDAIDELRGLPYAITEKLDGSSMTAWADEAGVHVCSRNYELKQGSGREWAYVAGSNTADALRRASGLVFQGELCGPGIQKNRLGLKQVGWFIFSVYDRVDHRYLDYADALKAVEDAGLTSVPTLETGASFSYDLDALLECAKGFYAGTKNRREGVVVRPQQERYSPSLGGRLSFKALNNDFLLKDEE